MTNKTQVLNAIVDKTILCKIIQFMIHIESNISGERERN